ncbi:hypothetical protein ABIA39_007772 [Nocardia sp. GAS34]
MESNVDYQARYLRFTQGRVVSVFACHARVSGDQAVAL